MPRGPDNWMSQNWLQRLQHLNAGRGDTLILQSRSRLYILHGCPDYYCASYDLNKWINDLLHLIQSADNQLGSYCSSDNCTITNWRADTACDP